MDIIDLIKQQTPEERQALFNEFIKLLNQKREYVDIPERIVCSACQVFVDTRDGTNEDGSPAVHADEAWWKDAMSQEFVVSREELPSME